LTTIRARPRQRRRAVSSSPKVIAKIGTRIVRHGRYVVFQLAEVAVTRALFGDIVWRIDLLRQGRS
jgi:hypothetical protein